MARIEQFISVNRVRDCKILCNRLCDALARCVRSSNGAPEIRIPCDDKTIRPFKIAVNNSRWRYRSSKDEAYGQTDWQTSCKVEAHSPRLAARKIPNNRLRCHISTPLCCRYDAVSVSCSTYRQIFCYFPIRDRSFWLLFKSPGFEFQRYASSEINTSPGYGWGP